MAKTLSPHRVGIGPITPKRCGTRHKVPLLDYHRVAQSTMAQNSRAKMTKLLVLILILKIAVVVVVGIACGALILRFIFEVGATQTSTNSRGQQWPATAQSSSVT
jgi:hypothetical protein